ncbi:hypothetical protein [Bacillus mojavensis]|uniref:hypothetical protein n=1 Tax=Bacillus mojavensis TaxID=72360 RepID=UPI002DB5D40F|nr:hypothetical protein [Bacillus mojavensis]MEC1748910.1 hypothetical protein [Bacillus mojavensis]
MTDFERKVYQIIVNMHLYGKNTTLDDLKRKTGKSMVVSDPIVPIAPCINRIIFFPFSESFLSIASLIVVP